MVPLAARPSGITIPHEHLLIDLGPRFLEPASEEGRALARAPVTLENLSWVRRNYLSSLDNIRLTDERVAIEEASLFRRAGGGTIVDAGSIGIRPDPLALQRISRATGLHIVAATGYYTEDFHPSDMDARTEDDLTREIVGDLRDGIGETGIRAGIIGELGCSWPLHPNERKGLRAAARAQRETGAPITVHPGRDQAAPFEILDVLVEAGADARRVVMGHVERTGFDVPTLLRLARTGCYVEYDWFGEVLSMHPTGPVDVPSDAERIDRIRAPHRRGAPGPGAGLAGRLPQDTPRPLRCGRLRPHPGERHGLDGRQGDVGGRDRPDRRRQPRADARDLVSGAQPSEASAIQATT